MNQLPKVVFPLNLINQKKHPAPQGRTYEKPVHHFAFLFFSSQSQSQQVRNSATTMYDPTHSQPLLHTHCSLCGRSHLLPRKPAMKAAKELMTKLADEKCIVFEGKSTLLDKDFSTDSLYGQARGKMFGVLSCRTASGETQTLKAFSGQYNGMWEVDGWAPPLFDVQRFVRLTQPVEKRIKTLGREAQTPTLPPDKRKHLLKKRKVLSRQLMKEIHRLYRLHNFRGSQCSLADLFTDGRGIPTGTGDCCAPKLLNLAAKKGLQPLGLAEFYWGRTNKSATRRQGCFYPPCQDKCGPILGFLLCGLEERTCTN